MRYLESEYGSAGGVDFEPLLADIEAQAEYLPRASDILFSEGSDDDARLSGLSLQERLVVSDAPLRSHPLFTLFCSSSFSPLSFFFFFFCFQAITSDLMYAAAHVAFLSLSGATW